MNDTETRTFKQTNCYELNRLANKMYIYITN